MADQNQETAAAAEEVGSFVEVKASSPPEKVPQGEDLSGEDGRVHGSFKLAIGANITEDVEIFGEELVRDFWLRSAVIKGQAQIRRELEAGTHPNDLKEVLAQWRPDVERTTQKDPRASALQYFNKLSEEEKQELLAQLIEQAG